MDLISWVTVFGCLLLAICSVRLFIQSIVEVERRLNQTNMLRQQASIRYRYRNRNTIFPEPSNNNQEEIMEEETDIVIVVHPNTTIISLGIKCKE